MKSKVYIFDPTVSDQMSRVRGIGHYLKMLDYIHFPFDIIKWLHYNVTKIWK